MNKVGKFALTTGAVACVAGILLFGIGSVAGGADYVANRDLNNIRESDDNRQKVLALDKTKLADVQSLQLDLNDVDLRIKPSDDGHTYLEYKVTADKKGNDPVSYDVTDGVLTIQEAGGGNGSYYQGVHVDISFLGVLLTGKENALTGEEYYENVITLYLPTEKGLESSTIQMEDGDLSVEGLTGKNVDWTLGYGDLELKNSTVDGGAIVTKDGDVALNTVTSRNVDWTLEYGDLEATSTEFTGGSVLLEDGCVDGKKNRWNDLSVTLKYQDWTEENAFWNNITLTMADGDVDIEQLELTGENTIDSKYGDVTIELTKESRETTALDLAAKDGDVNAYHSSGKTTTATLAVTCADGDIDVE